MENNSEAYIVQTLNRIINEPAGCLSTHDNWIYEVTPLSTALLGPFFYINL